MSINVLIVDDSDVIRNMIIKTMRLAQIPLGAVFEAANGREALDILDDQWIDVVLADINMPVMDGIDMIGRIRDSEQHSALPVVVISTEGAESRVEQLRTMGVEAYLRKPFTPEQVRDVISEVAGRIMGAEHRDLLESAMGDVLERFAMMFAEAVDAVDSDPPNGDLMRARMTFSGAATGALVLAAPRSLCLEMAANALGVQPEDERAGQRAADAMGEVANMTAGLIATALEAHEDTRLAPPEVTAMCATDWAAMATETGTVQFMVEEHPMLATLGVRTRT